MPDIRRAAAAFPATMLAALPAAAQKKYDPNAGDTEIELGQTMPCSGRLSALITLAKAEVAHLQMINDQDGVNGRNITMISLDDGFSPPKTVEQTRKLGEDDQVLTMSGSPDALPTGDRSPRNGASLCAVHEGRSVASTMGFTAVDGLMMGTRTGALDPGVLLYLMQERGLEAIALFVYRIVRETGSLVAALGGLDGMVFTAGIGENDPATRPLR